MVRSNQLSVAASRTWPAARGSAPFVTLGGRFLNWMARAVSRRSRLSVQKHECATTAPDRYSQWRSDELRCQLEDHFPVERLAGRSVVDFGCGGGELCEIVKDFRPARIIGVDKSSTAVALATSRIRMESETVDCEFICNNQGDELPLPAESIDLILCFDTVEHIARIDGAVREWRRLLKRDGRVWIWWSPWRGPYGHHLEALLPLPWIHLVFPHAAIFDACAARYDDSDFVPRVWDRDPVTGKPKPNKWRTIRSFSPFLNRLTRRHFERVVRGAGLTIHRRDVHGFSGTWMSRATRPLTCIPGIGECFVSYYVYELGR